MTKQQLKAVNDKFYRVLSKHATRVVRLERAIERMYWLVARLDDGAVSDFHIKQIAHLSRQEIAELFPKIEHSLPRAKP